MGDGDIDAAGLDKHVTTNRGIVRAKEVGLGGSKVDARSWAQIRFDQQPVGC